jgi:ferredoxin-type protein NapG
MRDISRRGFLRYTGASGLLLISPLAAEDIVLRPPGARADFLARCIRCGKCMEACPYDSIRPMDMSAGANIHTPWVDPLDTPCYLCQDRGPDGKDKALGKYLRCGEACPTGALVKIVNDKKVLGSVPGEYKMGVSVLDRKICLAWEYDSCGECYYNCPLKDKALLDRPPGTKRKAASPAARPEAPRGQEPRSGIRPFVDTGHCIGCGMCNYVCPVRKHIAESRIRRGVKLTLFEQRYAGMVRNLIGRAGKGTPLPAIRVMGRVHK